MSRGWIGLELQACAGRAVLVGHGDFPTDPNDLQLPTGLASDLHEWARFAEVARRAGQYGGVPGSVVSQRGRLLAARLAASIGVPVGYADPTSGTVVILPPGQYHEPTPWTTGLAVSAATAALAWVALLALSQGLSSAGTWFVVLANLLVAAGLAPSIWLGRATPVWRWVSYGVATGIPLAWLALVLSLL